ncbi:hypothetical protein MNBD_GAMMA01-1992 [hydrothermal vent metagenome]|uniref:Right handed beta helix domain-containing protein n=1 Tax=hydrothermal vent metagenome TaxID=652676 RepID=A0A3B0VH11_9ZZZZ
MKTARNKPINIIIFLLFIWSTPGLAGNLPFEIFQPQANLDTTNRFYKAYPGLEYNVRLAVAGGGFPYQFALTNAPTGMTIDARGEISWANPAESNTPYQVTASVTDSEGASQSVSWTITVTTTGFLFVDALNGTTTDQGGTGTLSNPWKTMKDVYGGDDYDSKWSSDYQGSFVYWREGEYILDAFLENCSTSNCHVPWYGNKPKVWIAYPGETPEINFNSSGRDGYLLFTNNTSNLYLDGFDFNLSNNSRGKGLSIGNNGNITIRKNTFRGLTNCWSGGNNSQLFFSNGGNGQYTSAQDNIASESCGYWLLGYASPKTVVENNHITTNIPLPIGPKSGIQNWTIRGNHIQGQTDGGAIFIQEFGTSGDIEINFNLIQMSQSSGPALRLFSSDPSGPIYVNRNTFVGQAVAWHLSDTKGPWEFTQNVIINNAASADKITRQGTVDESRLLISDNLVGDLSDNIVNSQGELTAEYIHFIGNRGHQVGGIIDSVFANGFE